MKRENTLSGLWWIGSVLVVTGVIAFALAFAAPGTPEEFLHYVLLAAFGLIVPGAVSMVTSILLDERDEPPQQREPTRQQ